MSRLISFAVLIAIIIIIGLLFYRVLIGFFIPLFLAAVLVVVFRPLHRWVLVKTGHRDQLAAIITTLLILLTLFLPIAVVSSAAATQVVRLVQLNDSETLQLRIERIRDSLGLELPAYHEQLQLAESRIQEIVRLSSGSDLLEEDPQLIDLANRTNEALNELRREIQQQEGESSRQEEFDALLELTSQVGRPASDETVTVAHPAIELKSLFEELKTNLLGGTFMALAREKANPSEEEIRELTTGLLNYVQPRLLSITGATGSFMVKLIIGSVIMVVATFFFLYDGPGMLKTVMNLSPLDDTYEHELLLEFDRISRAVVLATLLSAIVQGLTAGLGYAVAGMNYLALLIMLTTVFAMVPFVGPSLVWIPVCLYMGLYQERYVAAILLACWGVLVVGTVDNLVKAIVLHGQSQLHPLFALLSVLGGVQALGPVGIVVGPMVVAMLQTLLGILQRELMHFDKQNLVLSTQGLETGEASFSKRKSRRRSPTSKNEDNRKMLPDASRQDSQPEEPQAQAGNKKRRRRSRRGSRRTETEKREGSDTSSHDQPRD
ncbi:MAG: AI-2E family transporter [bacterium]|nr:AI-2E family transporter [bacterium]